MTQYDAIMITTPVIGNESFNWCNRFCCCDANDVADNINDEDEEDDIGAIGCNDGSDNESDQRVFINDRALINMHRSINGVHLSPPHI